MKRKIIDKLIEWNQIQSGKPVLLTGAKGVGKTYLAYDYARSFYEHILYLNFERDPGTHDLFYGTANDIAERLLKLFHIPEDSQPESRVLILDEITYSTTALEQLSSLQNQGTFPKIIVITSSPLYIYQLDQCFALPIHPLEFDEFLLATANSWYIEAIRTHYESNKPLPDIVHKELLAFHELYLQIGGMPGVINEYLNFNSLMNISEQHCLQLSAYHDYLMKDFDDSEALKMNQVIDSLPQQLIKTNKKFQYNLIRKGTTHTMYKDAIHHLKVLNYVIQTTKCPSELLQELLKEISNNNEESLNLLLKQLETSNSFKLYLPDVGFLYSKIVQDKQLASETSIRKALLENYIAQTLHAKGYPLMFWESDSMAKVDYILPKDQELIPLEIYISDNTRSKCVSILKRKYNFTYSIKISSKNFEFTNQIKYVPYYAAFCL